jgi:hypothetical protein
MALRFKTMKTSLIPESSVTAVLHVGNGLVDNGVGDGVADVTLAVKGLLSSEKNN